MGLLYRIKKERTAYLFLLPAFIVFAVFTYYPIVKGIGMSFEKFSLNGSDWVGLENYRSIFQNEAFLKSIVVTLKYTVLMVFLVIFIATGIALMIEPLGKNLQTFFRAAFYLPGVLSSVVLAIVWNWMFEPNFGFLNYLLGLLGLPGVLWLGDPNVALFSIILAAIITGSGGAIVILISALNGISAEIHDAVKIDGANKINEIIHIKIPLIMPTILYLVVVNTLGSFQAFDMIYLLTRGGPNGATQTLGYLIYYNSFGAFQFGAASAQAVILLAIVLIIAALQFRAMDKQVYD